MKSKEDPLLYLERHRRDDRALQKLANKDVKAQVIWKKNHALAMAEKKRKAVAAQESREAARAARIAARKVTVTATPWTVDAPQPWRERAFLERVPLEGPLSVARACELERFLAPISIADLPREWEPDGRSIDEWRTLCHAAMDAGLLRCPSKWVVTEFGKLAIDVLRNP